MKKLGDFIAAGGAVPIKHLSMFAYRGKAGQGAAQHLARAAEKAGIEVTMRLPDDVADDFFKGLPPS
jgi:hypothetical protein